jgi:hypothetical protein
MNPSIYSFLHVSSVILLVAVTFGACAAPTPERRKQALLLSGIASVVALVAGFALMAKRYPGGFELWMWIKLACWLGLSALCGMAFRKPENAGKLTLVAVVLVLAAVAAVYFLAPGTVPAESGSAVG